MISQSTLDKVYNTMRVEEIVGDFVQLKRAGANYKGLSPFSDEKTPSFMVSPSKGIWKDFSSGKGGNSISFIMELEHCSFPEAIKYIANKYNIEVEEDQRGVEENKIESERESLYNLTSWACSWFEDQLNNTSSGKAIGKSYFIERGFTEQTIKHFRLGYNPDLWTSLCDDALKQGFTLDFLEKTGLASLRKEENRYFDKFKGRVIFPIFSLSGKIAGFGGRTLKTEKQIAKYLNSPESLIYKKSDILYGIFQSKNAIVKNDNCYLVEGYTDVLSLFQAGIQNVVASSGTALTNGQIRLIKRFTQNICVLYDGDAAGIKASFRGIDMLLENQMNVRVLTFPDGDDPDSFAKKISDKELKNYLEQNQTDFINFKSNILLQECKNDPIKRSEVIKDIVISISKIEDFIKREIYIKQCSEILDLSVEALNRELAQIDKKKNKNLSELESKTQNYEREASNLKLSRTAKTETLSQYDAERKRAEQIEKEILYLLLSKPYDETLLKDIQINDDVQGQTISYKVCPSTEIFASLEIDNLDFLNSDYQTFFVQIKQDYLSSSIDINKYVNNQNAQILSIVVDLISEYELEPSRNWMEKQKVFVPSKLDKLNLHLSDLILRYKDARIILLRDQLSKQFLSLQEEDAKKEILKEDLKLIKALQKIRKELGGRIM